MRRLMRTAGAVLAFGLAGAAQAQDADQAAELAKKLANPVASLISVPLQYNYDENYGPAEAGSRSALNVQPVIPFSLGDEWNLILRTIVPLVDQQDLPVAGVDKSGLGDVTQSFFFSPKQPVGGWIVGVGPVGLYPTASDELLGGEKWAAGPTALALRQASGWTWGALTNHLWSFAGDENRAGINVTFLQPFVSYTTRTKTTFGLNAESTYDWNRDDEQLTVPVNLSAAQLLKLGPQILQVSVGARYWAESPTGGPQDMGYRVAVTLLYPK